MMSADPEVRRKMINAVPMLREAFGHACHKYWKIYDLYRLTFIYYSL